MKPQIYFTTNPRTCTCTNQRRARIHRDYSCPARCDATVTVDGGTVQYAGRIERVQECHRCMLVHEHHGDHGAYDDERHTEHRWPRG